MTGTAGHFEGGGGWACKDRYNLSIAFAIWKVSTRQRWELHAASFPIRFRGPWVESISLSKVQFSCTSRALLVHFSSHYHWSFVFSKTFCTSIRALKKTPIFDCFRQPLSAGKNLIPWPAKISGKSHTRRGELIERAVINSTYLLFISNRTHTMMPWLRWGYVEV